MRVRRTTRRITTVIRVTKSGKLYCNNCHRWNQAYAGQVNPVCGNCRHPLL